VVASVDLEGVAENEVVDGLDQSMVENIGIYSWKAVSDY
jgi:hypothetical protein